MVNMEVLQTFSKDVWLMYNAELEKVKLAVEKERDEAKKLAEQVSRHAFTGLLYR
jgi:hypothetical protein